MNTYNESYCDEHTVNNIITDTIKNYPRAHVYLQECLTDLSYIKFISDKFLSKTIKNKALLEDMGTVYKHLNFWLTNPCYRFEAKNDLFLEKEKFLLTLYPEYILDFGVVEKEFKIQEKIDRERWLIKEPIEYQRAFAIYDKFIEYDYYFIYLSYNLRKGYTYFNCQPSTESLSENLGEFIYEMSNLLINKTNPNPEEIEALLKKQDNNCKKEFPGCVEEYNRESRQYKLNSYYSAFSEDKEYLDYRKSVNTKEQKHVFEMQDKTEALQRIFSKN